MTPGKIRLAALLEGATTTKTTYLDSLGWFKRIEKRGE